MPAHSAQCAARCIIDSGGHAAGLKGRVTLLQSMCPRPEGPVCLQKPDSAGKRMAVPKKRRVEEIALDDSEHEYNPLESDISEPESVPQVGCC